MKRVDILMAIYRPHIPWLIQQLDSLNAQTHPNLRLLVYNDDPTDETDYTVFLVAHITRFPFELLRGICRLGSNGAFAALTKYADADFVAYCDQDDIWLPEKIARLLSEMERTYAVLVCSDMYVIDKDGREIAASIADIRPRQKLRQGKDVFRRLLAHNFVTGCTTLVRTDFAKKALPFPDSYVYDGWLALRAAKMDALSVLRAPLIRYRVHGANQTGTFKGITDKCSYYEKRILLQKDRLEVLSPFCIDTPYAEDLREFQRFTESRAAYFQRFSTGALTEMFRLRSLDPCAAYLEIALPLIPNGAFLRLVRWIQAGLM